MEQCDKYCRESLEDELTNLIHLPVTAVGRKVHALRPPQGAISLVALRRDSPRLPALLRCPGLPGCPG